MGAAHGGLHQEEEEGRGTGGRGEGPICGVALPTGKKVRNVGKASPT